MVDIKVGQLYSFHLDPNDPVPTLPSDASKETLLRMYDIVMEVTRIDGFVGVTAVKDRTGWFEAGHEYIAKREDVKSSGNYRLIWDPVSKTTAVKSVVEYGADCPGCKKHYPHAEKTADFKCWACRNGA